MSTSEKTSDPFFTKADLFLGLLKLGVVTVILDGRRPGVVVPESLLTEWHIRLDYGLAMAKHIDDLIVTDDGIKATLSFQQTPFPTFVPWSSVWVIAIEDGTAGKIYYADAPSEAQIVEVDHVACIGGATPPAPVDSKTTPPMRRLASVPSDVDGTAERASSSSGPPTLRIVK